MEDHQWTPPTMYSGSVCRPRFDIPQQQIRFLLESGFTLPQIASVSGVSLSAVRRRMAGYGLSVVENAALSYNDQSGKLSMNSLFVTQSKCRVI